MGIQKSHLLGSGLLPCNFESLSELRSSASSVFTPKPVLFISVLCCVQFTVKLKTPVHMKTITAHSGCTFLSAPRGPNRVHAPWPSGSAPTPPRARPLPALLWLPGCWVVPEEIQRQGPFETLQIYILLNLANPHQYLGVIDSLCYGMFSGYSDSLHSFMFLMLNLLSIKEQISHEDNYNLSWYYGPLSTLKNFSTFLFFSYSLLNFISLVLFSLSTNLSLLPSLSLRGNTFLSPALSLWPSQAGSCHYTSLLWGQHSAGVPPQFPYIGLPAHHSIKTAFFEVLNKVLISDAVASSWTVTWTLSILRGVDCHLLLTPLLPWCDFFPVPPTLPVIFSGHFHCPKASYFLSEVYAPEGSSSPLSSPTQPPSTGSSASNHREPSRPASQGLAGSPWTSDFKHCYSLRLPLLPHSCWWHHWLLRCQKLCLVFWCVCIFSGPVRDL